jgi:hypothetical protein
MIIAIFAAVALVIVPVLGQTPARIRGTITAIDGGRITVKEWDGGSVTLKTGGYTTYANVVPSSLDAIKVGDFVDSAVCDATLVRWLSISCRKPARSSRRISAPSAMSAISVNCR